MKMLDLNKKGGETQMAETQALEVPEIALEAPVITVLTFGFAAHQAMANCAIVQPSSSATGCNALAVAIRFLPSSLSKWGRSHS